MNLRQIFAGVTISCGTPNLETEKSCEQVGTQYICTYDGLKCTFDKPPSEAMDSDFTCIVVE